MFKKIRVGISGYYMIVITHMVQLSLHGPSHFLEDILLEEYIFILNNTFPGKISC